MTNLRPFFSSSYFRTLAPLCSIQFQLASLLEDQCSHKQEDTRVPLLPRYKTRLLSMLYWDWVLSQSAHTLSIVPRGKIMNNPEMDEPVKIKYGLTIPFVRWHPVKKSEGFRRRFMTISLERLQVVVSSCAAIFSSDAIKKNSHQ